jgi:hypothetical protein
MPNDRWLDSVVLVDQLPSNAWVEGLVVRPNGRGLLSRLDQPELWDVDVDDPAAEPRLLHTFPDSGGIIDVCPVAGRPDQYAVISGAVDMEKVVFLDFVLWRVELDPDDARPPQVARVAALPDAGLLLGATPLTDRFMLVADSGKHSISWIDLETGHSQVLVQDDNSMKAETDSDFFGLNRLRVAAGHLWYTNSSAGLLCRVPVELTPASPDAPIRLAGEIACVADDIPGCDGLAVAEDGSRAYMVNYATGTLWRVDVDAASGEGVTLAIMERLVSPTSVELRDQGGKKVLYVVCCGENETGWVNDGSRSWGDIAEINSAVTVSVTVTEEVV